MSWKDVWSIGIKSLNGWLHSLAEANLGLISTLVDTGQHLGSPRLSRAPKSGAKDPEPKLIL